MTSEDSFWGHIRIYPDDYTTLLVFSDWLEEQGDPRAEGMRAMGIVRWSHYRLTVGDYSVKWVDDRSALPRDWYRLTQPARNGTDERTAYGSWWSGSLVDIYSEVALAFSRLPDTRRTELLQQEIVTG